jgi:tetratricopeptide (TPR) repeat protein
MRRFRKRQLAALLAALLWLGAEPGSAQAAPEDAARLDALFADLAEPGREDWQRIEGEINRLWSRSGSDAMDLLLRRGRQAIEAGDYAAAVEHLTALTDHAPDFAEGWNARATAFFLMDEYALSIADIERVLALNPRHFGAMMGLATMLEQMGETGYALQALRAVQALNPNRPEVNEAVDRLTRMTGEAEL